MLRKYQQIPSPVGKLYLVENNGLLEAVIFAKNWPAFRQKYVKLLKQNSKLLRKVKNQLEEYFAGKRKKFTLPYSLNGSDFQKKVWKTLNTIPFGETRSYKFQAGILRKPGASRAIGRADGLNPLCIILPCHRVIGSNGRLTGYAGGLRAKRYLLNLESQRF